MTTTIITEEALVENPSPAHVQWGAKPRAPSLLLAVRSDRLSTLALVFG